MPLGTEIFYVKNSIRLHNKYNPDTLHEKEEKLIKIADLDEESSQHLLVNGGEGGDGNLTNRQVNRGTQEDFQGMMGEEKEFELRLKMIADVGFIGFPNAGKSTLLAAITRAFPKIAPYPFTTLRPYIGLAKFVDNT